MSAGKDRKSPRRQGILGDRHTCAGLSASGRKAHSQRVGPFCGLAFPMECRVERMLKISIHLPLLLTVDAM